jgi:hypothetical protein
LYAIGRCDCAEEEGSAGGRRGEVEPWSSAAVLVCVLVCTSA